MNKNILYYPTIEFKKEDYKWLWIASLLWDKIYRIVPDGYCLDEPQNIQELCSSGDIGIPLAPNRYSEEIASDFLKKIEEEYWNAAALEFNHDDIEKYKDYTRVHKDKVDVTLRNIMLMDNKNLQDDEWLFVPQEMANVYMTYLANHIASENNLALNTHNYDIWTASTFFQFDDAIQDGVFWGRDYTNKSTAVLASILIKDFIPENLMGISPKELLKFRKSRGGEREEFLLEVQKLNDKLAAVKDERIIEQIVNDELSKVEKSLEQYKKSMDLIKATKWTGSLSMLTTLAIDGAGYINPEANFIKPLTTCGLGIGLITGLIQNRIQKELTPYSYLTSLKTLNNHNFGEYNYHLYRKLEEFIND